MTDQIYDYTDDDFFSFMVNRTGTVSGGIPRHGYWH